MADEVAKGPLGSGSASQPKAGAQGGVASPDAKDQTQAQANEGLYTKSQIDEMIAAATKGMVSRGEMEDSVGRVRSQYDRARNEERGTWEDRDRAYQGRIHELTVKDMDENARARYERDLYASRQQELEDRLYQVQAELETSRQSGQYLKALQESFGVDIKDVDLTDVDSLSRSAFQAAANAHMKLRQELDELKAGKQPVDSTTVPAKKAPDVVTQAGGTSAAPVTLMDLRKSVSQRMGLDRIISEDELFGLAERPDQTGVDLNVVIQAMEAELAANQK